jgi:hypothetical protein
MKVNVLLNLGLGHRSRLQHVLEAIVEVSSNLWRDQSGTYDELVVLKVRQVFESSSSNSRLWLFFVCYTRSGVFRFSRGHGVVDDLSSWQRNSSAVTKYSTGRVQVSYY